MSDDVIVDYIIAKNEEMTLTYLLLTGFDFRSEINGFSSDNDLILPFFYISGRRSEPEVEHVIFDVQFNDYLRVL